MAVFEAVSQCPLPGSFRTSRDVRLESGMRSKADEYAPGTLTVDVRADAIFCSRLNVICPVQSRFQK